MEVFFSSIDYVWEIRFSYFFLVKVSCGDCFTVEILKDRNTHVGRSLVAQWLGSWAFTVGAQDQSLVWELRSCKLQQHGRKKREKNKRHQMYVCVCVNTCVKYFDPKFLFSSFEKILGIFCVLVAMLNAVVIGANKMSIAFIDYDIFGCRHRKLTLLFIYLFCTLFFFYFTILYWFCHTST